MISNMVSRGEDRRRRNLLVWSRIGPFIATIVSVSTVYCDFSKAFDRVNHNLLLEKMVRLHIDTKTIRWIKDYLRNRRFCVKVNDSFSPPDICPSGVPQGSCVGPLLFCIFVLDIKDVIPPSVQHKLYADDLKIYGASNTAENRAELQSAIDEIQKWCRENDMKISIPKCVVVSSGPAPNDYKLNGELIPVKDSVRDLGVFVTPELDFSEHISRVVKSASLICNMIFRCFIIKKSDFYVTLYNSLVIPRFQYCCVIWRPHLRKHIDAVERVQRRFLRRLRLRCGTPPEAVELKPISTMFDEADLKMYEHIRSRNEAEKYFIIRGNNLRSGETINAVEVAATERINQQFSWRVARLLRNS